eukprot:1226990-Ditylum_brightwellii.AAC.1
MKFLCKHHQKLGSNMKDSCNLEVRDTIKQEVKNSKESHQEKTIAKEVVAQEYKQESSRKLDTIISGLTFCSKNYYSSAWFEKLLRTSVKRVALNSKGFSQQQF